MHCTPAAHALPQVPQCTVLVCRSTHSPAQSVWPVGQARHAPPVQTRPAAHGAPQALQCASSVCVSTQTLPHIVRPAAHWHLPPTQLWPIVQTLPHAPQWASLVASVTSQPLASVPSQLA